MKLFSTLVLGLLTASIAHADAYPICRDPKGTKAAVVPCVLNDKEAGIAFVEMMLGNPEGYKLDEASSKIEHGLVLSPFTGKDTPMRVLMVSGTQKGRFIHTTLRYDVELIDCRGTSPCGKSYVWTVIENVTTDGDSSKSRYENYLAGEAAKAKDATD